MSHAVPHHETKLLPPVGVRGRALAIVILTLTPFLVGALALFLGQDANWDLRNYHWYNAYAFLNDRYQRDLLPSQTPYFYNPAMDVPFYLLATHVSARVAAFVLGTVQGLNFVLLFMLAYASLIVPNPRHKVLVCAFLAALGLLGGGGIAMIGTVFYDNVTSLGLWLSALLVIVHCHKILGERWKHAALWAVLAGLPAGVVMGLKLPSVVFCVGLCGALLLSAGPWRRRFGAAVFFGCGVLLGLAVSLGPWAWFLQTHYGSPLFPYFNNFFQSPLAPLTSARDVNFVPSGWHDRLLLPFLFALDPKRVGEIAWQDFRIPLLYALLPLAVLLRLLFGRGSGAANRLAQPYAARYLLWAMALAYAAWVFMFGIYRYLVPLEMLSPLLILFAVGMLPLRLTVRGLLAAFLLVGVAATVRGGDWTRLDHWLDHAVEVERPALSDSHNLMILMAGFEPYAHVVTQFPPQISFVRIQSNFSSPDENKGINGVIHSRIAAHTGDFMLLIPSWQHDMAQAALSYYALRLKPETCQPVIDRLYDSKLQLCALARTNLGGDK